MGCRETDRPEPDKQTVEMMMILIVGCVFVGFVSSSSDLIYYAFASWMHPVDQLKPREADNCP